MFSSRLPANDRKLAITPRGASLALATLLVASLGCKKIDDLRGESKAEPSAVAAPAASASGGGTQAAAGARSGTQPMPFAVGQWSRFKTSRNGAPAGDLTYRITGKEGDAFWIRFEMHDPSGKLTEVEILIDFEGGRASKNFDVKQAKVKLPTGQTHSLSGPLLNAAMKGFSGQLAALAIDSLEGLPQEDVKVPAGEFKGCYYRDYDFKVMNIHSKGRVWNHTKVPINAMVKNESTTDGAKVLFELEAYGTSASDGSDTKAAP